VFRAVLEEIAVTLFVTSTEVNTLPRQIWSGLRDNIDPAVAAISVLLIALTLLALSAACCSSASPPERPGPECGRVGHGAVGPGRRNGWPWPPLAHLPASSRSTTAARLPADGAGRYG
jgi:hypothetical protein